MNTLQNTLSSGLEMLQPREAVIAGTRNSLNTLAQETLPLAMGLGTLSVMAYGIKKMFKPGMDH